MKKTAIALVVAGLAAASVAQAAPQANTFYVGAKAGQASFHDGIKSNTDATNPRSLNFGNGYHRNSVTYGVFGGYQVLNQDNFGLAVEAGYDDFGRVKFLRNGKTNVKHTNHGAHLGVKGSYSLTEGLDFYGRAGAALVRSDYKVYNQKGARVHGAGHHSLRVSPVFAAGFEYALPSLPELALRLEYQWLARVGKLRTENRPNSSVDYNPWIGSINAGLSYRFGQGAAPVVAPEVVSKTFNLASEVTFAFG